MCVSARTRARVCLCNMASLIPEHSPEAIVHGRVCMSAFARVRIRMRACVHACVHVCTSVSLSLYLSVHVREPVLDFVYMCARMCARR